VQPGAWFVLPTAFDPDGNVDLASQSRLVEAAISWGATGLTALGVMGEAAQLAADERQAVLETVMSVAGRRVPVLVGCSAQAERLVVGFAEQARLAGASGVTVSAPTLMRNVDLLPGFYQRVGAGCALPIVVQDEPNATGVSIPVSVLARSMRAAGSTAVKLEDPPTPSKISRLLEEMPEALVFGGLGGVSLLAELGRGAGGTMTGFAFPEVMAAIVDAVAAGAKRQAAAVFDHFLPLITFEGQPVVGLAIRKEILRRRGVLATGVTRGQLRLLDAAGCADLDDVLKRVELTPAPERLSV
jgi:4-hydroxy-tetrahydrodipicolinate synthase